MAMYYYATNLNEATRSSRFLMDLQDSQTASESSPTPPLPPVHSLLSPSSNFLNEYYDDDYYSNTRDSTRQHIVMNGGINFRVVPTPTASSVHGTSQMHAVAYQDTITDVMVEVREGEIISASIDMLVEMFRPGATKQFVFTFLLCSRLFIKPHELLKRLCKRYLRNFNQDTTNIRETIDSEWSDMVSLVRLLGGWMSVFPYDFRDERMMVLVRSITERCANSIDQEFTPILEKLLEKLTRLEQYESTTDEPPRVPSVAMLSQADILTTALSPAEMASQLTIVELHKLSFVGPEEFVLSLTPQSSQAGASNAAGSAISLNSSEGNSSKNLEAYAQWFNRLSYLVATDILKAPKSKYRARVIEQWVMTARECFNIGNFNSVMAIISALNLAPIARLKKTWNKTSAVCGQQLRQLELIIEPTGNHHRYRAAAAAAPIDSMVPLLSVTCRDLHFANQAGPTLLPGNRVNFEKCTVFGGYVNLHLASRRLMCDPSPLSPRPVSYAPVWNYLNFSPTLTDRAFELVSFDREPPLDYSEKERVKRLRANM